VAAGATSRTFTVTTSAVSAQTAVAVSAAAGEVTRSATLTLNPPTPAAPTLQSPANGATGVAQPATLNWNDVPNATSYEVLVDDTSSMAAPYVANPTVSASQVVLSGLPARQLWWRVRARNAAGVFGAFSATRSFTPQGATGANPPASGTLAAPTLLSPAVDARFAVGQNVVFDWSDVSGAASYSIAVDDQETFSSPTLLRTVPTSTFSTTTLPAGRMWFRVQALDASGTAGPWSGARRFEVR
jgi:predicted phage tail protein